MEPLYVAWRTAMKKVWRLPWTTHNEYIPLIADVLPPNLLIEKRAIKFVNKLLASNNSTVKMITGMGIYGNHSVLGRNYKYLLFTHDLSIPALYKNWHNYCQNNPNGLYNCDTIKELIVMRDSFNEYILDRSQAKCIIDVLCIE